MPELWFPLVFQGGQSVEAAEQFACCRQWKASLDRAKPVDKFITTLASSLAKFPHLLYIVVSSSVGHISARSFRSPGLLCFDTRLWSILAPFFCCCTMGSQ